MNDNQDVIEKCLKLFRGKGVEGEIFLIDSKITKVSVLSGRVENLEERKDRGCGIRVCCKKKLGFSYTSDLSERSIDETIRRAHEFSFLTSEDASNILPPPGRLEPLEIFNLKRNRSGMMPALFFNPALLDVSASQKTDFAIGIEKSARDTDARVGKVKGAAYRDFVADVHIANTAGIDCNYRTGKATGHIELSATDGTSSHQGYHQEFGSSISDMDPQKIGRAAALKALDKLGARDFRTAKTRVVLNNETTSSFFAETFSFFSAKKVLKNKSALTGKLGKKIGSTAVTLIDDGRKMEAASPAPFDAEGMPTQETFLIREGVLENYLHNYQTAIRMALKPTSSCVRGSYTSAPKIGINNLYFRPSTDKPEEIIADVKSGIYVTDLLGLHTADTITGDFSLGASGRYIENGRLSYPVHKIAISGNILTLLGSVEAVANDLKFFTWGGGVTMLLREMVVSGT